MTYLLWVDQPNLLPDIENTTFDTRSIIYNIDSNATIDPIRHWFLQNINGWQENGPGGNEASHRGSLIQLVQSWQ